MELHVKNVQALLKNRDLLDVLIDANPRHSGLHDNRMTNEEWRSVNMVLKFLKKAADCTTEASGSNYCTISCQVLSYSVLTEQCEETMEYNDELSLLSRAAD